MADSETSRTLPAITRRNKDANDGDPKNLPNRIDRRNLLLVAERLLSERIANIDGPRESGPTPVTELWPRWYAYHHHCLRATHLRKRLASNMLQTAGDLPISELERAGDDGAFPIRSVAALHRIALLDVGSRQAELRERHKRWREADQRLGYSAVAALEQELAEQAGVLGRVMLIAPVSSAIEITAKLHCLIVTHDPGLKLEDAPWPELRMMLKDLIRIFGKQNPKAPARMADDAVETEHDVSP
ncbi:MULTISPECIES: hypothetical protein [unclassified Ensifer]|uniref:hypothetical protein n=1 Tax=unclassified Ensifer TaxID=2633371 RepID=UPI00088E6A30|nr:MULTISPECIES: hypothetical protein [unclassified Ensifer]SDN89848.1 hypothetical protein SAMN05216328_14143 [Ensifer sp. YR511]